MAKILYEEYFGGEAADSSPECVNNDETIMSRWQYKAIDLLMKGERNVPNILRAVFEMEAAGKLVSENYDSSTDHLDKGAVKLNSSKISHEDLSKFLDTMISSGFIDKDLNPLFTESHSIRKKLSHPVLSGPRGGFIELTNDCLLSCITCYNEFARSCGNSTLSFDEIINVIDQYRSFGATSMALTGGETTLAKGWDEIASHTIKDCGLDTRIYTCGIYRNSKERDSTIKKLIELNPSEIRITYAGLKHTNDLVRRINPAKFDSSSPACASPFDEITRTIVSLVEAGQNVKVNFTFAHENLGEIAGFARFISGISEKYKRKIAINIGPLRAYGNASRDHDFSFSAPNTGDFMTASIAAAWLKKEYDLKISTTFDILRECTPEMVSRKNEEISARPRPYVHEGCSLGKAYLSVGFDGTVQVCGIMGSEKNLADSLIRIIREDPEKYSAVGITEKSIAENKLNNLKNASLEDIWYGSPVLRYFQLFYRKEQCEPCDNFRVICSGICPAMALVQSNDLRKGDRGCFKHMLNSGGKK